MISKFSSKASLGLNVVLTLAISTLAILKLNRASTGSTPDVEPLDNTTPAIAQNETMQPAVLRIEEEKLPNYADISSPSERRRQIIDRLRALGVPNELLGRVARVDFEVEWDDRFQECWGDMEKMARVQLDMSLAKDAAMQAALGEEGFKQWDQNYMLWEAMNTKVDVSAAETESLYEFKKTLQKRMLDLDKARLDGTMDDADINEAVDAAYAEFNRSMRNLLGDERYAKSQQLDREFVFDNFKHEIAKANPTDAQCKELFAVEQDWNRQRMEVEYAYRNDTFSPDYLNKLRELDAARDREFERVLGADAYESLRKQQDSAYAQMKKYQNLWELDDNKIDFTYRTMKDYQRKVDDYQAQVLGMQSRGEFVEWDSVNRNLLQLATETQNVLRNQMGSESFARLQRNRVLRWATLAAAPGQPPR